MPYSPAVALHFQDLFSALPPVSLCVQHVSVHTVLPMMGRNLGDSFHSADSLPSLLFMHQWQIPFSVSILLV